jgi:hypothetical protein
VLVFLVVGSFFAFGLKAIFLPKKLEIERNSVEQSKAFNDSQMQQAMNLKTEYIKLIDNSSEEEHKEAVLNQLCYILSRLQSEALTSDLSQFKARSCK